MYRAKRNLPIVGCFVLILATLSATATVSVPNIIGSHMVLQADKKLPIWGKADPGEKVTVMLGDHKATDKADKQGRWMVKLPKMKAGGPVTMTITGKDNILTLNDILIGEVWVASGQSNMQWTVENSNNAAEEIAAANYPNIRLFYVERKVADKPQDNCNGEWVACSPETIPGFSAVAYYFGRELYKNLDIPIGLIHTSWGGTPAESWTSRPSLEAVSVLKPILERWDDILAKYPAAQKAHAKAMAKWKTAAQKAKANGQPEPKKPRAPIGPDHPHRPSSLYNAMIAPLIPYAFQGAIWYQCESNASRAYQYRTLFPCMIKDWRKAWKQGAFPFLFVQLANFTDVLPDPGDSDWAELREAQTMTLNLENTGMAVIIDIGEAKDIHPKNKQDVGKRLALNALAETYDKEIPYSGPMYKRMRVKNGKAILSFDHTNGGLVAKGSNSVKGFAIAGADKKFVWADAVIDGENVIVASDKVAKPVAVRYAWANNPVCNLYNGAGLPASPFRTDNWPGITINNK